jgi:hypothetical protein
MHVRPPPPISSGEIWITEDVIAYINRRKSDFRISTSCGGPILLPVSLKPPKPTDLQIPAGDYMLFVSLHQARYLSSVHMGMVPFFLDEVGED